ncbi:MAG: thioredoxin domain-containing protein [Myxococcota bacterium]
MEDPLKQYGAFGAATLVAVAGLFAGPWAVLAWLAAAVLVCVGVLMQSARWGAVSAALLGFACSAYLFSLKLTPDKTSICDINAKVSCDVVNSSPASMLFGSVPIAVLGMAFFLGVVVAVMAFDGRKTLQAVGLLALVGCVYSVYLAFAAIQLGATCPMCMAIYASNGLLLAAGMIGTRQAGAALFDDVGEVAKSTPLAVLVGTFVVVALVGQGVYGSQDRRTDAQKLIDRMAAGEHEQQVAPEPATNANTNPNHPAPAPAVQKSVAQELGELYVRPRGTVVLDDDEPVLGDPKAPYVLVEYACFGCPHCAMAFPHLQELVDAEPEVQVRFRSFPLSNECNPDLPRGGRPEVCRGAMAARCANQQGKFWEFARSLFTNQRQLGDPLIVNTAEQLGLDYQKFSDCMADPATLQGVMSDAKSGVNLQIMGTPTMLLRGATPDGTWVELCGGADTAKALIEARKQGIELLPGASQLCPME